MTKQMIVIVGMIFIFPFMIIFPVVVQGSPLSFDVKLYGGLNYLSGGDLNTGLKGFHDYEGEYFCFFGLAHTGGEYNPVHWGLDFGGDFILRITPALGVGVGAGYIQGTNDSAITYGPVAAGMTSSAELSAVPLRLSVFYTLTALNAIRFNGYAGLGYYLAKASFDFRPYSPGDWVLYRLDADGGGLGFHGGLGIELKVSPAIAFFLEGQGRYASLGGFEGTASLSGSGGSSTSATGTVYSFTMIQGLLGNFPGIFIFSTPPSGPNFINVSEAKIDFSGFSLIAGIIFRFGAK